MVHLALPHVAVRQNPRALRIPSPRPPTPPRDSPASSVTASRDTTSALPGVAPAIATKLATLGLTRPFDLVLHLPLRYEDETRVVPMAAAPHGLPTQVEGIVVDAEVRVRGRRQLVARVRADRPVR